jgi:hypothetical protein
MAFTSRITNTLKSALRKSGFELRRVKEETYQGHFIDAASISIHTPPRVLINTTSKAGTYLFAAVVEELGFHHSYLHLGQERLQAYDRHFLSDGLRKPRLFDVKLPLTESRKLIRSGELAVGHIPHSCANERDLANFKIILAQRELRASIISYARMIAFSGRWGQEIQMKIQREGVAAFVSACGEHFLEGTERIFRWSQCSQVRVLRFEDLLSSPTNTVKEIAEFLGVAVDSPMTVHQTAFGKDTLTKGERYPKLDWNDKAERLFSEIGGPALNVKLGYDEKSA